MYYAMINYRLGGEKLVVDPAIEGIVDNRLAAAPLRRTYRKPGTIDDTV